MVSALSVDSRYGQSDLSPLCCFCDKELQRDRLGHASVWVCYSCEVALLGSPYVACVSCRAAGEVIQVAYGQVCSSCGTQQQYGGQDWAEVEVTEKGLVKRARPPDHTRLTPKSYPKKGIPQAGDTETLPPPAVGSYIGRAIEDKRPVILPTPFRLFSEFLLGVSGTGKSTVLANRVVQDIEQGISCCLVDAHGDLTDDVLSRIPQDRLSDVIYFDMNDDTTFFGLNPLAFSEPEKEEQREKIIQRSLSQVKHIFEKVYNITPTTPTMYHLLHNAIYTLIVNPGCTLFDLRALLTDEAYRSQLLLNVDDENVLGFWEDYNQMGKQDPRKQREDRTTLLNKLDDFVSFPIRYIVGQASSTLDFNDIMDNGKILLVRLDLRQESATALIGSILVAQILNAGYNRQEQKTRRQFHFYVDEFQNFATKDFSILLTQSRKFSIGCILACQNLEQLDEDNKAAALGCGNWMIFKTSGKDADDLKKGFRPKPQPLKTRKVPVYERQVQTIKVKKWVPPEAQEKLKKMVAELDQINGYIEQLEIIRRVERFSFSWFIRGSYSYTIWGDRRSSDIECLEYFYRECNPPFRDVSHTSIQEVFPSDAVKATIRTQYEEGERFYIVDVPSNAEKTLKEEVEKYMGYTSSRPALPSPKRLMEDIGNTFTAAGKPLPDEFTSPSALQELEDYTDTKTYPLYIQKSVQDILNSYRKTTIYHFVPERDIEPAVSIAWKEKRKNKRINKFCSFLLSCVIYCLYYSLLAWIAWYIIQISQIWSLWTIVCLIFLSPFLVIIVGFLVLPPLMIFAPYPCSDDFLELVEEIFHPYLELKPDIETYSVSLYCHKPPHPAIIEVLSSRKEQCQRLVDRGSYVKIYREEKNIYWSTHFYPRLREWCVEQKKKEAERSVPAMVSNLSELLCERRDYLKNGIERLRLCEKEFEEVIDKEYISSIGELVFPYYRAAVEIEEKISHSVTRSKGRSRTVNDRGRVSTGESVGEGHGESYSFERIPIYQEEPGEDESLSNAWDRLVEKLVFQPNYQAHVRIMTETRKGLFEPVQHQIKTCSVEDIDEELERKYGEKGIKYIVREGEDLEKWKDEIREENKEQKLTRDKEQILREQRKEILPGPVGQEEMAKHIAIKPSKKQKRSVREG